MTADAGNMRYGDDAAVRRGAVPRGAARRRRLEVISNLRRLVRVGDNRSTAVNRETACHNGRPRR